MTDEITIDTSNLPDDAPDQAEQHVTDLTNDVRQAYQLPSDDEWDDRKHEHEHHYVRWTTPTVTEEITRDGLHIATVEIEGIDLYCFTCEEYIGIDWPQPPRSRKEAFWLDGPPEEVSDLMDEIRRAANYLVKKTMENHPFVGSTEEAVAFIVDEIETYESIRELADAVADADH